MVQPTSCDGPLDPAAAPEPEGVLVRGVAEEERVREYVRSLSEELALMARRAGDEPLASVLEAAVRLASEPKRVAGRGRNS